MLFGPSKKYNQPQSPTDPEMGLNSAYFDGLLLEQIWIEYECTKIYVTVIRSVSA